MQLPASTPRMTYYILKQLPLLEHTDKHRIFHFRTSHITEAVSLSRCQTSSSTLINTHIRQVARFHSNALRVDLGRTTSEVTAIFGRSEEGLRDLYEGWKFNFGNAAVTFDTAHLQSSYFHRTSMYSPELCRTRSQR